MSTDPVGGGVLFFSVELAYGQITARKIKSSSSNPKK